MKREDDPMRTQDSRGPRLRAAARVPVGIAALSCALLLDAHEHAARADAPPGRYTAGTDGAVAWVKDNQTGLVWKKAEEPGTFSWAAAKTQCASPWRLPTAGELLSLVDDTRTSVPAVDGTFFPGASNAKLWSSSPDAASLGAKAWNVDFDTGADFNADVATPGRVRCVR